MWNQEIRVSSVPHEHTYTQESRERGKVHKKGKVHERERER